MIPLAYASSWGPSYNMAALYLWAVTGEGKWMVIIWRRVSPAGSHFFMMILNNAFPSFSLSVVVRVISSIILVSSLTTALINLSAIAIASLGSLLFIQKLKILKIGSRIILLKPLTLPSPGFLLHLPSWSTKWSPHSRLTCFSAFVLSFLVYRSANCFKLKKYQNYNQSWY